MTNKQEKRIGWWMDASTCIGCDRSAEELQHVNYIDMRPRRKLVKEPHAHNLIVMLCEGCSNLYVTQVPWIWERVKVRLIMARRNCKCETFFMTNSDTPIEMMHSRS